MQYLHKIKFLSLHKYKGGNTHLKTMIIFDSGAGGGKEKKKKFPLFQHLDFNVLLNLAHK